MKLGTVLALAMAVPACLALSGHENYLEAHERLKRDLFHNYDKDMTPWMDKDRPFNVSAGMSVSSMDMDSDGMLNMVAWFRSSWTDERLTWSPEDYHGIAELRIPASQVWVPDMEVYNAEGFGHGSFSDAVIRSRPHYAILYSNGHILFIPPTSLSVRCQDEDYLDWPWGEYDCSVKIGSWTHSSKQMKLSAYGNMKYIKLESPRSPVVFTEASFQEDPFRSKVYDCCPEHYESLNYKFKVQRQYRWSDKGFERNPNEVKQYKYKSGNEFV